MIPESVRLWQKDIDEVANKYKLHEWLPLRRMGTQHSARVILGRLSVNFPDFLFNRVKNMIFMTRSRSKSLLDLATERDIVGHEKYGEDWTRSPISELKEEIADAYNYVQWAKKKQEITEDQEKELLKDLMVFYHKIRLYAEGPTLRGAPGVPVLNKYRVTRTIGAYNGTSERDSDRDGECLDERGAHFGD